MQFGALLLNYFNTWEESLSTIKYRDAGPWNSLLLQNATKIRFALKVIFQEKNDIRLNILKSQYNYRLKMK